MNKRKPPNSGSNIYKESSNKAPTSVIEYGELCYRHGYKDRDDEIIRCKDCKYRGKGLPYCAYFGKTDFCSKGERKESE